MKKSFIAILTILLTISVSAQKLELGFVGGYQHTFPFALVGGDIDKIDFNHKSGAGFNVGGYFGWNFNKLLGIDFQLMYAMRSYSFDMQYKETSPTIIFKRQTFFVELPLHLNYKIKVKEHLYIAPLLGVSLNMAVNGKDIAYEHTLTQKPIDKVTTSDDLFGKNGRMNRFELSPEIGCLVKYKHWGFRPIYSVGVNNLTKQKFGWTFPLPEGQSKYLFNRELKLSIIYTFDVL